MGCLWLLLFGFDVSSLWVFACLCLLLCLVFVLADLKCLAVCLSVFASCVGCFVW